MLWEFFTFEVRSRWRQPGVWSFALVFALLAFGATTTDAVRVGGGTGQTAIDSPYVVAQMLGVFSVIGVLIVTAFVATVVVRDYEQRTYSAFFTSPIRKRDLLLGRFAGGLVMAMIVMLGASFGMAVGGFMPWLDPQRLVGFQPAAHLQTLLVLVLPNMFVMGAVFFAVGTLTRRVLFAYVAVAAFFVIYIVSQNLMAGLDNDALAAYADPFGMTALAVDTRYWTVTERNSMLPAAGASVLGNRVLWIAIGVAALAFTVARFRMGVPVDGAPRGPGDETPAPNAELALPHVRIGGGWGLALAQLRHQLRVELAGVLRSTPFLVIALFCALNMLGGVVTTIDDLFGTPVYPVTHLMVESIDAASGLFVLIVIVFYAGDLVTKERRLGLGEVYDALPMSSWVPLAAKTTALVLAVGVLLAVSVLTTMGIQLAKGYTDLEPGLYLRGVFGVSWSGWALMAILAVVLQAFANHKYVGFMLMIGFFVFDQVMPALDLERSIYRYGHRPAAPYSDMNGYGHFVAGLLWYRLYWTLAAALLLVAAYLVWPRGTDTRLRLRLRRAQQLLGSGKLRLGVLVLASGFVATGAYILHNTDGLNRYVPEDESQRQAVAYEQGYKQYEELPQPRIRAVDVDVELYPRQRVAELKGTLTLVNKTDVPIPAIHVDVEPDLEVALDLPGSTVTLDDRDIGYRILELAEPLAPAAEVVLGFDVRFAEPGFVERGSNTEVVYDGSFLHSPRYIPRIGYSRDGELSSRNERRKRGLPERERMHALEDTSAYGNTYISHEADWIEFSATVGTDLDQIALAPGYVQHEWTEGDRRYRRFEMDAPILDFYAFLSADWEVRTDRWNDVAIEVYHHRRHAMNVDRMIDATKKSLTYFSAAFSPYQHRQVRIVEFPNYEQYAQSFPNTIPYSESIGFIADLRDPADIDYVFYVTAHEVAHQWWAHQVIGADVQGSTVLSETLSQYSALMVMEREYGRDQIGKFLRYELDRYLSARGREADKELPLVRVEGQGYIHYNKGSLVMYALREYLGEDVVNGVLADLVRAHGFQGPPFPTSRALVDRVRAVTPPELAYLVEDLFETITLYDNRVRSVEIEPTADGKWKATIEVLTRKFRADERGAETQVAMDDLIEVSAYIEEDGERGPQRTSVKAEKIRFASTDGDEHTVTMVLDRRPTHVGIDPRVLLVDRDPADNVRAVE